MLVSYKTSFLTFESLRPLSAVQPPPAGLYAQAVAFAVLPVSLEVAATGKESKWVSNKFHAQKEVAWRRLGGAAQPELSS